MKAIQFNATIPRYALGLAFGKWFPSLLWNGLSCTTYREVPEPTLPGDDWVKLRTRYGGICGSDMGTIHLHTSPYFSPLVSFPFTMGHEVVGHITEVGSGIDSWSVGDRVVVEPTLWCKPRGFDGICSHCTKGEINRCARFTDGALSAGQFIGSCRDTGGSWSEYFLAHESQLYQVPEHFSDENAFLVEPLAVGIHAALTYLPSDDETALILGVGTVGLMTLAALRLLGSKARIIVGAKSAFQADAAKKLGATETIAVSRSSDYYSDLAQLTGGRLFKPIVGKRVFAGGVDCTFECVGSDDSLDDALRLTKNGGRVVLVGVPGIAKGVDWSPIFAKELEVSAAYTYHHAEDFEGKKRRTFDLAIDFMNRGAVDLGWLITHKFSLDDYARAFRMFGNRSRNQVIKAVFDFGPFGG